VAFRLDVVQSSLRRELERERKREQKDGYAGNEASGQALVDETPWNERATENVFFAFAVQLAHTGVYMDGAKRLCEVRRAVGRR
jgi:hypothetical protein